MKFSEIDPVSWPELQPYLDTCLLPLSGLTGEESPSEAADVIARTGQWLSPIEKAFKGRTVTMPAYHYETGDGSGPERINRLIAAWRRNGFRYVVLVSGQPRETFGATDADLFVSPEAGEAEPDEPAVAKKIADLWRRPGS